MVKCMYIKNRNDAFTLAEVLITLGIIGIVAAITMSQVLTNMRNKGYVERMKKAYTLIQNVTIQIINEEGPPSKWILDAHGLKSQALNERVVDMYAEKMNVVKNCSGAISWIENECIFAQDGYYDLSGKPLGSNVKAFYWFGYPFVLSDGSAIIIKFLSNAGAVFWGNPDIMFIVDVNGKQKPNKLGRDIFYFYMNGNENGQVRPYGDAQKDDCNKNDKGYTCAYKIISEGKMDY